MFPPTDRLGIKICGFKAPAQVRQALDLGADAVGINLWPKSKRHMPLEQARAELQPMLETHHHLIAVLVNPDDALLGATIDSGMFGSLQLHGDESPALVSRLMNQGQHIIKALQVRDASSLDDIGSFPCTDILLDAYNPGFYGGGGHAFPWDLALQAKRRFPDKRIILSGGLSPATVAKAVAQTNPAAVDVASGVESSPGVKDPALIAAFIREART